MYLEPKSQNGIGKDQKHCVYWSGGAEPVHGLRIVLREGGAGWAGLSSVRSSVRLSVRPSVTLEKGPKGLQNHQKSIRSFTKSEHAKSLFVLLDLR